MLDWARFEWNYGPSLPNISLNMLQDPFVCLLFDTQCNLIVYTYTCRLYFFYAPICMHVCKYEYVRGDIT